MTPRLRDMMVENLTGVPQRGSRSFKNFNDAVDVIVESARILIKNKIVPEGTTQTVRMAFKEVGLPT